MKRISPYCNKNGNCSATINVKKMRTDNLQHQWCNIYNPELEAKETTIPYCQSIASNAKMDSINTNFRVYPNPTTGNLNVEYYSKASGTVRLKVIDVNGKTLYTISNDARAGNNNYNLNLLIYLPALMYLN